MANFGNRVERKVFVTVEMTVGEASSLSSSIRFVAPGGSYADEGEQRAQAIVRNFGIELDKAITEANKND